MAQSEVMAQAKAGNPAAIAALLNRTLQPRGITATAKLDDICLVIELACSQPISQNEAIAFIRQGLNRLQPKGIQSVFVSAQNAQRANLDWMESFLLDGVAALPPNLVPEPELPTKEAEPKPGKPSAISHPPQKRPLSSPTTPSASTPKAVRTTTKGIASKGIEALLIGLFLAIVLFHGGFLKVIFYGAVVLVHEVGHAVTHWAFGRPAIPTVNLYFGGGVTLTFGQVWLINVAIYIGIAYLLYRLRTYPKAQGILVLLTLIYTYCLFTPTNRMLSVFMGHGMELVAIALCLHLSATGKLCRIPGDRAIYAMLGFFIFFCDVEFCWKLLHDIDYRASYEDGIGGMMDNDFVILANDYFRVDLSRIVNGFLLGCFLAVAVGLGSAYFIPRKAPKFLGGAE
jgi:hypothetical protein